MNARIAAACLIVALGLGLAFLYSNRGGKGRELAAIGAQARQPAAVPGKEANLQTPEAPVADPARAEAPEEQPTLPDLKVEPVIALTHISSADGVVIADAAVSEAAFAEILTAKYAGQTKSQLHRYLLSLDETLRVQRERDVTTKDQLLSPEETNAIQLERDWLKENINP